MWPTIGQSHKKRPIKVGHGSSNKMTQLEGSRSQLDEHVEGKVAIGMCGTRLWTMVARNDEIQIMVFPLKKRGLKVERSHFRI